MGRRRRRWECKVEKKRGAHGKRMMLIAADRLLDRLPVPLLVWDSGSLEAWKPGSLPSACWVAGGIVGSI